MVHLSRSHTPTPSICHQSHIVAAKRIEEGRSFSTEVKKEERKKKREGDTTLLTVSSSPQHRSSLNLDTLLLSRLVKLSATRRESSWRVLVSWGRSRSVVSSAWQQTATRA
ncbi:hypothetical protein L1887_24086 [Cichorium endivia]|nr:hypothetical protein L1887_24086 [Cichorium endivia]